MAEEEQGVTYSNKELFEKIDRNINDVKTLLETKADDVDVVALRTKVQIIDADVAVLKDKSADSQWRLGNVIFPSIAIVISIVAIVATFIHA